MNPFIKLDYVLIAPADPAAFAVALSARIPKTV